MTLAEQKQYRLGVAYVALSSLAWSSSGLFVRAISADLMTILFWRGIVSGSSVFLLFLYIERDRAWHIIRRMRGPSFAAAVLSTASMISGIGSIYYTSVADALMIYATVPFVTAGLAYVVIGERSSRATLVASLVAFAGVLVMLTGEESGGGWLGKLLAAIMTVTVAGLATVMRQHREVPMLPAMAASAWLCSFITFWFAAPLEVSGRDIALILSFGIVQNAMGLSFYTFGSRLIPAAEATLVTALEVPLTPLWVWLFMNEQPGPATLIGAPIVLGALFGHILLEFRKTRVPAGAETT